MDLAPTRYDYDCRTVDGYDPVTWTIRAPATERRRVEPEGLRSARIERFGSRESAGEAALRLGRHRNVLREAATARGYDTSAGLTPAAWDTVAASIQQRHARAGG